MVFQRRLEMAALADLISIYESVSHREAKAAVPEVKGWIQEQFRDYWVMKSLTTIYPFSDS
jgi:hypothetical protein